MKIVQNSDETKTKKTVYCLLFANDDRNTCKENSLTELKKNWVMD